MKVFNTLRVIFALIGVGMLAGAYFSFNNTTEFLDSPEAQATESWLSSVYG